RVEIVGLRAVLGSCGGAVGALGAVGAVGVWHPIKRSWHAGGFAWGVRHLHALPCTDLYCPAPTCTDLRRPALVCAGWLRVRQKWRSRASASSRCVSVRAKWAAWRAFRVRAAA